MDVYYKEKLHVNHFWEFKGQIVINIVNVIANGFVYKLLNILIPDLTLSFPGVTKTEFLITISIQYLTDK